MESALLDVRALTVELPGPRGPLPILSDVSFALGRGESLGLVGESGCGKSMTALALMGLLPPAARVRGRVTLDGRDLTACDEATLCSIRGRRVAMVFQEPMTALNPVQTIGAQVAEGPRRGGLTRGEAQERALQVLGRVGLPPERFSPRLYPHQLSGGQRQRVVIAIALSQGPDLLIADEPTTALDVTIQAQILDLITEVAAETRMGLILITHDLGIVAETAARVMVMYGGRIVEAGPTERVFTRRAHPYTRGLFAASPHAAVARLGAGSRRIRLATIPGQVPDPGSRPAGCAFAARCPLRTAECLEATPPFVPVGEGHAVACLHPVPQDAP
jgi:peptide/nickel transport system ATP-binding protein